MATEIGRKYALTKVGPGDYLLPSNDAQAIWRIVRGTEVEGDENERTVQVWQVWRWCGSREACDVSDDAWHRWELYDSWCRTRREAIQRSITRSSV